MDNQSSFGIILSKPISVWSRDLSISPKSFITNLAKATINGFKGEFDDCAENLLDSIANINTEEKIGQLAWILIYQSTQNSIIELVKECSDLLNISPTFQLDAIEKKLEQTINETFETKLVIDSEFLEHPEKLEIIISFSRLIEAFCLEFGATPVNSKAIASKLPNKFSLSIYKLWLNSSDKFQDLLDVLESPISKKNSALRKWQIYHQSLHVGLEKRVFKESFGLNDIYVKPRAFYKALKTADVSGLKLKNTELVPHIIDLHTYLEAWLLKHDTSDNLKLVSGQPGSGKSSFSKCFSSDIAKKTGYNVVLIQLHLLDMSKDLTLAIQSYCNENQSLRGLDVMSSDKLLIVFDGLDEISMQGKIGAIVSNSFISELKRKSEFLSQDKRNVKFIVTGRDLSIQSCENVVKESKKYLYILPYHVSKKDIKDNFENLYDPDNLLKIDQRHLWWENFCLLKGLSLNAMPTEIESAELQPISSQPLLGYLLALSYLRGQIDFKGNPNLNTIYQDLLDSVFDRQYASEEGDSTRTHTSVATLTSEDFDVLMQEVALAVWHSNGTTATENFIYEHLRINELEHLLDQFKNETENGVSSLLLSFYFRKHGQTEKGESTFEFTHKSFGEYLTAKKLVNLIIELSEGYTEKKKNYRKGKKLEDIIHEWVRATGESTFEIYLFSFVYNELINLNLSKDKIEEIYNFLVTIINESIQNDFALERFRNLTFNKIISYYENSNLALIALHSACSKILFNDEKRPIDFEDHSDDKQKNMGVWMDRNLLNHRFTSHLEYMNLTSITLGFKDFSAANLQHSSFHNSHIFNSLFVESQGEGIIMTLCDIFDCDFSNSQLSGSDFSYSTLNNVDFSHSYLYDIKMDHCSLYKVKLKDSFATNSDFSYSKIFGANFEKGDFNHSNFKNTELIDANLAGANFENACLLGCNLSNSNLTNATLTFAKLKGAKLKGAILTGVDLTGVDLTGVDLTDVDLTGVDLTNTILPDEFLI
jgi:uncharacterized protein YjbI with pentapeptide repeats